MKKVEGEVRKLETKEIKELVKKAMESGESLEAKYLIKVEEWDRPGPSFDDWQTVEIVEGEADFIEIDHYYNYPTTNRTTYLVIPKTIPVVLRVKGAYDYDREQDKWLYYLIFTKDGWKKVDIY